MRGIFNLSILQDLKVKFLAKLKFQTAISFLYQLLIYLYEQIWLNMTVSFFKFGQFMLNMTIFSAMGNFSHTLKEEIFAGINFREFFFGHFAGINFRELGFTEDFAGINFRELSLRMDFAGINFRE